MNPRLKWFRVYPLTLNSSDFNIHHLVVHLYIFAKYKPVIPSHWTLLLKGAQQFSSGEGHAYVQEPCTGQHGICCRPVLWVILRPDYHWPGMKPLIKHTESTQICSTRVIFFFIILLQLRWPISHLRVRFECCLVQWRAWSQVTT